MALDRKDVRAKLDPDLHEVMKAIALSESMDDGEWIESVLVREIGKRMHGASVIHEAAQRVGRAGKIRENPGARGRVME